MGTFIPKSVLVLSLGLFFYLLFFHALGDLGLVGPDEPRYAQVAKEMLVSGDLVTPRLYGQPWFEKPILYYWLVSISYKAVGISEFSARLISALAAVLGVFAIFWVAKDFLSPRGGVLAGLILASSPLYFSLARAATMDMLLTGTLTASYACLYFTLFGQLQKSTNANEISSLRSSPAVYFIYFFLAFSVLAKGPVGVVLIGGTLLLFLSATRQFALFRKMRPFMGILIFLALASPWYGLCYRANGWTFVDEFLLKHNLARFATDRYWHSQPFWFYLPVLLGGFFPWIFQLALAARRLAPSRWRGSSAVDSKELFLWLWGLVPIVFFSFSRSKLPGYILPSIPAFSILAAKEWEQSLNLKEAHNLGKPFRITAFLQATFVCVLGLALPFIAEYINLAITSSIPQLTMILCGVGIAGLFSLYRGRIRNLLGIYLAGIGLVVVLVTHRIIPQIEPFESSRQLAAVLRKEGFVDQPIFIYGLSRRVEYGLNFYLNTQTKIIYSENDLAFPGAGECFLITTSSQDSRAIPRTLIESETIFHQQKILKLTAK